MGENRGNVHLKRILPFLKKSERRRLDVANKKINKKGSSGY
jgi:hypothetical protein